jgi:hypothetical protein
MSFRMYTINRVIAKVYILPFHTHGKSHTDMIAIIYNLSYEYRLIDYILSYPCHITTNQQFHTRKITTKGLITFMTRYHNRMSMQTAH